MAPNETTVITDRVKEVQIRPYDQVFALTQYIINSGLQTNWEELIAATPTLLDPVTVSQPGAGSITGAVFDYPRIVVQAHFEEAMSGVLYMMCFKAGKFILRTADLDENGNPKVDENDEPIEIKTVFNLTGWRIAFAMQLGMTVVERESDDFKQHVLKAGEYSLNELQAKFDTAVFKPESSIYGDRDWLSFPKNIQDGLKFVLGNVKDKLLAKIKGAEKVGSVLKSNKPQQSDVPAMTFEPFKIQYQSYPWIDPRSMGGFKPSSGLEANQRLNYLLYCETTNGRDLPPVDKRFLPRKGNWTDGLIEASANSENVDFGSFHMARENFFDSYLLRKLRFLNRAMEPHGTWLNVKLDNIVDIKPNWNSDLAIGNNPKKSLDHSGYDFQYVSDTKWKYEDKLNLPQSHDQAGLNGWSGEAWADCSASVLHEVEFVPGSDLVVVTGTTEFLYTYKFQDKKIFKSDIIHVKKLDFTIKWTLTLDLEAVNDGGLQILTTFSEPNINYKDESLATTFDTAKALKQRVTDAVAETKHLKAALAKDLAGQQGLVLPAAGVFFFKNPILSHRGDLICSVAYSKVQPEKAFNPDDHTVINPDGKDRITVP